MALIFLFCKLGLNMSCSYPLMTRKRKEKGKLRWERKGKVKTSKRLPQQPEILRTHGLRLEGKTEETVDLGQTMGRDKQQVSHWASLRDLALLWDSAVSESSIYRSEFPFSGGPGEAEPVRMKLRCLKLKYGESLEAPRLLDGLISILTHPTFTPDTSSPKTSENDFLKVEQEEMSLENR